MHLLAQLREPRRIPILVHSLDVRGGNCTRYNCGELVLLGSKLPPSPLAVALLLALFGCDYCTGLSGVTVPMAIATLQRDEVAAVLLDASMSLSSKVRVTTCLGVRKRSA